METIELNELKGGALLERLMPLIKAWESRLQGLHRGSRLIVCCEDPSEYISAVLAGVQKGLLVILSAQTELKRFLEYFNERNEGYYIARESDLEAFEGFGGGFREDLAGRVLISTGGTSNVFKLSIHRWDRLIKAAKRVSSFLGGSALNSVCQLPLYHVSGFMQVMRALVTGGDVLFVSKTGCEFLDFRKENTGIWSTSLVPTQLYRMMQAVGGVEYLKGFDYVFVGGARCSEALRTEARRAGIRISDVYGTTETAAMVLAGKPDDFLINKAGIGEALDGIRLLINGAHEIKIYSDSIYCGYYPDEQEMAVFETKDMGAWVDGKRLKVYGRADNVINSGGEKVHAELIEAAIMNALPVEDVVVVGVYDKEWGEKIVAVVACKEEMFDLEAFNEGMKAVLERHAVPKKWIRLDALPKKNNEKVERAEVLKIARLSETERGRVQLFNNIEKRQAKLRELMKKTLSGKDEIVLEIGCGHGDYIIGYAAERPNEFCVALDILNKRLKRADDKRKRRGLDNIWFIKSEGAEFLELLPEEVKLGRVFLLFPDPWPKRRHAAKRLVQAAFLDNLAKYVKIGGEFCLRSDQRFYVEWARECVELSKCWQLADELAWPHEEETYFQKLTEKDGYASMIARRV